MENNKGCLLSWPAIVIAFIVFWPIGLGLLVLRMRQDRKLLLNAGRLISIAGWFSALIVLAGIVACIDSGFDSTDIGFIIFFLLAAVILIVLGKKLRRKGSKYKRYIDLVINNEVRKIEELSDAMSKPYSEVHKDIEDMIEKGYFKSTYINDRHEIVIGRNKASVAEDIETNQTFVDADNISSSKSVVKCSACGANNEVVLGSVSECEYCGSKIQG